MKQYIYDLLCTLQDHTRRSHGSWSWVPLLDLTLAHLYFHGWDGE